MPTPRNSKTDAALADSAALFAALGDETRLRLASRLGDRGPLSIAELTNGFAITRQAITKHLRVMEDAGLVRSKRDGRQTVWQLEQKRLAEVHRHLQLISKEWDDSLARLKSFVER